MDQDQARSIIKDWLDDQRGPGGPWIGPWPEGINYVTLDGDFNLSDLALKISEATKNV